MEAAVDTARMTVAEFHQLEFDDSDPYLYELLAGELVKKKAPSPRHQRLVRDIAFALHMHVQQQKLGEILFAPVDVFLSDEDAPQPDLVFVEQVQAGLITKDGVMGRSDGPFPTLIVEVISPSSVFRDRVTKKELYQQYGVQEYWLVEPANDFIEIFSLVGGRYELLSAADPDEGQLVSNALPGLVLDLKGLFGEE